MLLFFILTFNIIYCFSNFSVHTAHRSLVLKPTNMFFKRIDHADPDAEFVFYPPPVEEKDYGTGHRSILISFELPSGAYATTVLSAIYGREFKTTAEEADI